MKRGQGRKNGKLAKRRAGKSENERYSNHFFFWQRRAEVEEIGVKGKDRGRRKLM